MKVKNISARLHSVGGVDIIPGEVAEIPDSWADAINKAELVEVAGEAAQPVMRMPQGKKHK